MIGVASLAGKRIAFAAWSSRRRNFLVRIVVGGMRINEASRGHGNDDTWFEMWLGPRTYCGLCVAARWGYYVAAELLALHVFRAVLEYKNTAQVTPPI